MFEIPVTVFYTTLFLICIYRFKFFTIEGISKKFICLAFIFKVCLGIFNYCVWAFLIGHGDSLNYFSDAKFIYHTLPEQPLHYLQLTFGYRPTNYYPEHLKYVSDFMVYSWNNVEYTMVRINAILDVFTFASAFGNITLLNIVYFVALLALYKRLLTINSASKHILFVLFFFLPSVALWSGGLLKEGPVLAILCCILIQLIALEKLFSYKRFLYLFLFICLLYFFRDFLLILLLPNLFVWWFCKLKPDFSKYYFALCTIFFVCIIAWIDASSASINISETLHTAQTYLSIGAHEEEYQFHEISKPFFLLFTEIPYIVKNIFLVPNFFKSSGLFRIYQAVELLILSGFCLYLIFRKSFKKSLQPAFIFMVYVSAELLCMYALLALDADTLSRYKTIPMFFLIMALIMKTERNPETISPCPEK